MKKEMKKKIEVKIRYSSPEMEILKEKAKNSKKSLSDYQKEVTKKARIRIEVQK